MAINRRQTIKNIAVSLAGIAMAKNAFSYPREVHFVPLGSQSNEHQIINAGVPGNNTADLLKRVEKDCLSHRPKLTILMAGTNDMNSVKYIPLEQYRKNMISLIDSIKAIGSEVVLMTILPLYEPYLLTRHPAAFYQPEGIAERRKAVNKMIRSIAEEKKTHFLDLGRRFELIGKIGTDINSLIRNEANSGQTDGIHPTPNGYRFIGLTVYDYLADHDLPFSKIVCFGDSITCGDGSVDKESYPAYLSKLIG